MGKSALTGILLAVILVSAHPALGQDPKKTGVGPAVGQKLTPFTFDLIQGKNFCWACFG